MTQWCVVGSSAAGAKIFRTRPSRSINSGDCVIHLRRFGVFFGIRRVLLLCNVWDWTIFGRGPCGGEDLGSHNYARSDTWRQTRCCVSATVSSARNWQFPNCLRLSVSSEGFYYLEQFKDKGPSLSWRYTMEGDNNTKRKKKKELDDVGWQSDDSHETRRSLSAACKALRVFFLPSSGVGGRYVALKHKWWRPLHDGLIHQRLRSRMVGACRWVFYHWWDKVDLFEYRKVEKIVFENKVCLTCNIWYLYSLPKLFKSDFMDNDDEGQLIVRIWQSTGNPWILVSMKINVYREITWNR